MLMSYWFWYWLLRSNCIIIYFLKGVLKVFLFAWMIRNGCFNLPTVCLSWVEAQMEDSSSAPHPTWMFSEAWTSPWMFLSRDNEADSLVYTSTRRLPQIAQDFNPNKGFRPPPLHPVLFFYPSLFFHMMLSHNAAKRSIWYWCLPTDVLLAFAVEILSREKKKD